MDNIIHWTAFISNIKQAHYAEDIDNDMCGTDVFLHK